jgi:hypothetical protein
MSRTSQGASPSWTWRPAPSYLRLPGRFKHGRMNIKTPNPISRLFFKIYLLTEFVALCLTDFIDWRYIHSLVGIFDPACELLPPWMKELYLCTVLLPLYLLSDLPPSPLPKLCVSDQIQNLPNCFTTPNKMTSEDDIKGLVSLKFLRPWV